MPVVAGLLLPQPTTKASMVAPARHDKVESQDVRIIEKPPRAWV
jgi:hypothetical protein